VFQALHAKRMSPEVLAPDVLQRSAAYPVSHRREKARAFLHRLSVG
jgi:hypothetical protein